MEFVSMRRGEAAAVAFFALVNLAIVVMAGLVALQTYGLYGRSKLLALPFLLGVLFALGVAVIAYRTIKRARRC
ncbi:MAG: hypothetical protein AABX40_04305 [Candidatus Hydrothermarchaeota archaeon]